MVALLDNCGSAPIPIVLITGFLGSGKTTLLQQLLTSPELSSSAVLINEYGEVSIDHHLVRQVDEKIAVLPSGCVCCTIREDLGVAIRDLLRQRKAGQIPKFNRLFIETTGLADPAPIIHTLLTEPVVESQCVLEHILTTVDGANGEVQLARQPESAKQAAVAGHLIITKTDLVDEGVLTRLEHQLSALNPSAGIWRTPAQALPIEKLLSGRCYDIRNRTEAVTEWLKEEEYRVHGRRNGRPSSKHDERISAKCLTFSESIDWTAFCIWLSMLLHSHGADVLRVKGLINVRNFPGPVIVQGVQHFIHPPIHIDSWLDNDRRSKLVFITRDIDPGALERSLAIFNLAARKIESQNGKSYGVIPSGAGAQIAGRPYRRAGGLSWTR